MFKWDPGPARLRYLNVWFPASGVVLGGDSASLEDVSHLDSALRVPTHILFPVCCLCFVTCGCRWCVLSTSCFCHLRSHWYSHYRPLCSEAVLSSLHCLWQGISSQQQKSDWWKVFISQGWLGEPEHMVHGTTLDFRLLDEQTTNRLFWISVCHCIVDYIEHVIRLWENLANIVFFFKKAS